MSFELRCDHSPTQHRAGPGPTRQRGCAVGDGFAITRSDLSLQARVPGIERDAFGQIADKAKSGCPVSKLPNATISLDWALA